MPNRGARALKDWLDEQNLSQTKASFRLEISPQLISNYLKGEKPGLENAIRMRDVAEIAVDWWRPDKEAPEDTAPPEPSEAHERDAS